MKLEIPSFAKINLNLHVLGKREDGYHEIASVFQTIDLHDLLSIEESDVDAFTCSDPSMPLDSKNLVIQARDSYRLLTGNMRPVSIHLTKRIPSPGGLGGGSSNAAATLIGLRRLFEDSVSLDSLKKSGTKLGADVAYFFAGGTAFCSGIGEHVERLEDWDCDGLLLASANESVKTPWAYGMLAKERLTKEKHVSILKHYRNECEALNSGDFKFENDFSGVVFSEFETIRQAFEILYKKGDQTVGLSGSGPTLFCLAGEGEFDSLSNELNSIGVTRNYFTRIVGSEEYSRVVLNS